MKRSQGATSERVCGQDLPEGWAITSMADTTDRVPNVNPGRSTTRKIHYVDISSICNQTNRIIEHKEFAGASAPSRARRPIQPGDILFSNVRTYLRNVAIVLPQDDVDICSTGFTVLRPSREVEPGFLLYYALTDSFIECVGDTQTGTHYPATSDAAVLAQPLPVAPAAEQRRIVAQVEALLARVNAARERLARVRAVLKRFRQAVLAAACDGRLTENWRNENHDIEPATALLAAIRAARPRHSGKGKPSNDESMELPERELPDTWSWCRVRDLADVRLGGTPSRKVASYWNGHIPWVSSGEVANCRIESTAERITRMGLENSNAKLYPAGTVLIAMIGEGKTRGQAAILDIDACTNQNAAGLVFEAGKVNPEYIWYWALSEYEQNRDVGRGGNQPALNGGKVRALPVPLPPRVEQDEIVRVLRRFLVLADTVERRVTTASVHVDKLTQAILAKAFRGELVPTEAELARAEGREYEPASVLLERLRAQRSGTTPSVRRSKTGATAARRPRRAKQAARV